MENLATALNHFVEYAGTLSGSEKGEAQVFCDRLFQAFGHGGYKEAGATLEAPIDNSKGSKSFADLIWKPRLLIEMKSRGADLSAHYQQALEYWIHAVPHRPRYVLLCNFDEIWIYDFDRQLNEPVDRLRLEDLPRRYSALAFLQPQEQTPIFQNDLEAVSRTAAKQVTDLLNSLVQRGVNEDTARRFVLQIIVAMFSEDIGLLPAATLPRLIDDCLTHGQSSYDVLGGLLQQMNNASPAGGGRYQGVPYFNGGLFATVVPLELTPDELRLIGGPDGAATRDWTKINPAIFGAIFQQSMNRGARHAYGAHYTSEADILRVVRPTIIHPFQREIDAAVTLDALKKVRQRLLRFRVLDPACGSGNFLYVTYREMVRLETRILRKIRDNFQFSTFYKEAKGLSLINPHQFFGLDCEPFGIELSKVTLLIGKKLALDEARTQIGKVQDEMPFSDVDALPLENLDANLVCSDALFSRWPTCDAIIGNPPYQSKNKVQQEFGRAYLNRLRDKFPDVDGRSDYCVYWFRKAHDHLKRGDRAGLVGTNTIRQNYSRMGGLDYIVANGGTIIEAVSTMAWTGEAVVYVSIVCWIKGEHAYAKRLYAQEGSDPSKGWRYVDVSHIGPSLSFELDVTEAQKISANATIGGCFQGQTHGNKGFLLSIEEAEALLNKGPRNAEVLFPYLTASDLLQNKGGKPSRYVIEFRRRDQMESRQYSDVFSIVERNVLPDRQSRAEEEQRYNSEALEENPNARVNWHHKKFLDTWWLLSYTREDMVSAIEQIERYIVCGRVTARPIFEFISSRIRPNDAVVVFPFEDDYSFGILQSSVHWTWFINRCSTLKGDPRYTSNTVFDTFPWPQQPSIGAARKVAEEASALREVRNEYQRRYNLSLRELYRTLDAPGRHPVRDSQNQLDRAVCDAYGSVEMGTCLEDLLALNEESAALERSGAHVTGPGIPAGISRSDVIVSSDCVVPAKNT